MKHYNQVTHYTSLSLCSCYVRFPSVLLKQNNKTNTNSCISDRHLKLVCLITWCHAGVGKLFSERSENLPTLIFLWISRIVTFSAGSEEGCQGVGPGFVVSFNFFLFSLQATAPLYNVKDMTTPTVLFVGAHDVLGDPADAAALKPQISNLIHYEVIPGWNHLDFLYGIDAAKILYPKILYTMEKFE